MMAWEQLVKQCILGTGQQSGGLPVTDDPQLTASLDGLVELSPEQQLLAATSIISSYRQSGLSPWQTVDAKHPQSAREALPYCSVNVDNILRNFLLEKDLKLITQAFTLIVQAGQIIKPALLPDMLTLAALNKSIRPTLLQCMGERGKWLSVQNPDWRRLQYVETTNWQDARGEQRQLMLHQARAENPAQVRLVLESIWSTEPAKERLLLIEGLQTNLGPDDLRFLRNGEKDRSMPVREEAALYRLQLGDEQLEQSLLAGLEQLIDGSTVSLPGEFAPHWAKFGISEKPGQYANGKKLGQKAGWLYQCLKLISPTGLAKQANCSIAALVDSITASDNAIMMGALDKSAKCCGDENYLQERFKRLNEREQLHWLWEHGKGYPLATVEPLILKTIDYYRTVTREKWWQLLELAADFATRLGDELPPELSQSLIEVCLKQMGEQTKQYWAVRDGVDGLGYYLHPSVFETIRQQIEAQPEQQINFDTLLTRYQQRVDLHKEFNS